MQQYLLALATLIFLVGVSLGTKAAGSYSRGPYGALSCKQNGYVTFASYTSCSLLMLPATASGDLIFSDWDCSK